MSEHFRLADEQMARLQTYFPKSMASRGLMIAVCRAGSSSPIALV